MPNHFSANNLSLKFFSITYDLMRLGSPTGYLLVFFPSCLGINFASNNWHDLYLIPLFFIGSILSRGGGCIVNDMLDRELDAKVGRTKNRPLASGFASMKNASLILIVLMCCSSIILFTLSVTSIMIGFITLMMIAIYPLMKRITYFPQIFLGLTFNLGFLIGYASISDSISLESLILYSGLCLWTIGYDTIYAFMDLQDDKKAGIRSLAVLLEHSNPKVFIFLCYSAFIGLYFLANIMQNNNWLAVTVQSVIAYFMLIRQIIILDTKDINNCLQRFKSNVSVGFLLAVSSFLFI